MPATLSPEREAIALPSLREPPTPAALGVALVRGEDDVDATLRAVDAWIAADATLATPAELKACAALPMPELLAALWRHAHERDAALACIAVEDEALRRLVLQHAPRGLLAGCVVQNVATAASGHEALALYAHRVHRWHLGGGALEAQHGASCRRWAESLGLALPALTSARWERLPDLSPAAWALPAYWLALAVRPRTHIAELMGAALFELALPLPVEVQRVRCAPGSVAQRYVAACAEETRAALLAEAPQALAAAGIDKAGLLRGFARSLQLALDWRAQLRSELGDGRLDPAAEMLRLVQRKARYAVGYHGRLSLGRTAFDEAIAGDPQAFVERLAKSPWIAPGRPDDSLLLARQVKFGGPMFRVFSPDEIEVLRRWIASLGATAEPVEVRSPLAAPAPRAASVLLAPLPSPSAPPEPMPGVRELYFRLLNLEAFPRARHAALVYARDWLARSARSVAARDDLPPVEPAALRAWFEARAQAQLRSYAADAGNGVKSRAEVIEEALQLCPMVLIDGAWIQRFGNAGLVDSGVGALLFQTYSDEIGNGEAALNHPTIYRALIEQMGIALPDTTSRAFAEFERFDSRAFEVPVFWLCASLSTRRYLPELLGLNLAMELSGVGGAYRHARDELRRHGFSTLFVDLHNTIDNVSSGHSAMALEAIERHLDEVVQQGGADAPARQWQRVRTGYAALMPPPRRWADRLVPPRYGH